MNVKEKVARKKIPSRTATAPVADLGRHLDNAVYKPGRWVYLYETC